MALLPTSVSSRVILPRRTLRSSGTRIFGATRTRFVRSARWDECRDEVYREQRMILRSDHVAGAAFVVFGAAAFAVSGDLPFGSLAAPGAGMMPKLLLGLMVL